MRSPATAPTPVPVEVEGGTLATFRYGAPDAPPSRTVVAVHGITASSRAWPAVARALPEDWALVAVDLRGRGASRDLPGPTGMARHGADLAHVAAQFDPTRSGDLVLLGHSMGAYVSLLLVDDDPTPYRRLVLVDGGVPLPVPAGVDHDKLLQATLGPALTRLSQTYADVEAYSTCSVPIRLSVRTGAPTSRPTSATTRSRPSRASGRAPSRRRSVPTDATCSCSARSWTRRCSGSGCRRL
jgi:pimeloyl-ACP methyl ester carboxylesterase